MQTRIARFPAGVSGCIRRKPRDLDEESCYMQQPRPTNATGVDIILSVIDPNNNAYQVGTATSDANGNYHMTFAPEVPGEYTLIATFPGSTSYYSSSAETAFVVEDAPTPSPNAETVQPPPTEMYITGATAAIITAIAIVGALILLTVKKRP